MFLRKDVIWRSGIVVENDPDKIFPYEGQNHEKEEEEARRRKHQGRPAFDNLVFQQFDCNCVYCNEQCNETPEQSTNIHNPQGDCRVEDDGGNCTGKRVKKSSEFQLAGTQPFQLNIGLFFAGVGKSYENESVEMSSPHCSVQGTS